MYSLDYVYLLCGATFALYWCKQDSLIANVIQHVIIMVSTCHNFDSLFLAMCSTVSDWFNVLYRDESVVFYLNFNLKVIFEMHFNAFIYSILGIVEFTNFFYAKVLFSVRVWVKFKLHIDLHWKEDNTLSRKKCENYKIYILL